MYILPFRYPNVSVFYISCYSKWDTQETRCEAFSIEELSYHVSLKDIVKIINYFNMFQAMCVVCLRYTTLLIDYMDLSWNKPISSSKQCYYRFVTFTDLLILCKLIKPHCIKPHCNYRNNYLSCI